MVAGHGVNTVWLTSSLFNLIVDEDLTALTGLSQVLTGGERLSARHVARFLDRFPDTALINGYGPVESTVFATTHRVTPADCARPDGIPLGRPVPGTRVVVLQGDRPCAPGEPGEICVAGDGLAHGYLGEPDLTAEKFTHVDLDGERVRLYRTGGPGRPGRERRPPLPRAARPAGEDPRQPRRTGRGGTADRAPGPVRRPLPGAPALERTRRRARAGGLLRTAPVRRRPRRTYRRSSPATCPPTSAPPTSSSSPRSP